MGCCTCKWVEFCTLFAIWCMRNREGGSRVAWRDDSTIEDAGAVQTKWLGLGLGLDCIECEALSS